MNSQGVSQGQLVAAIGGLLLLISLFLKWAGPDIEGAEAFTGWELPVGALDIYLVILGFFAMLPALSAASGADIEVPFVDAAAAFLLALVGLVQLVFILIFPGEAVSLKIGFWIALLSVVAITYGSYTAMNEDVSRR
jgi:hypothetical protein